jgi:hypothetical protein
MATRIGAPKLRFEQYPPSGGRSTSTNDQSARGHRELDRQFEIAVALDDEHDRRHGLGEYAPDDLTLCACGTRHDFDACPVCTGGDR